MNSLITRGLCFTFILLTATNCVAQPTMDRGKGHYLFSDWKGADIPVWTYLPGTADTATAPILIIMHGVNRDADRYRDNWADVAEKHGFIVVAPAAADFVE